MKLHSIPPERIIRIRLSGYNENKIRFLRQKKLAGQIHRIRVRAYYDRWNMPNFERYLPQRTKIEALNERGRVIRDIRLPARYQLSWGWGQDFGETYRQSDIDILEVLPL